MATEKLVYYNAEQDKELPVSEEFLEDLRNAYDTQTKVDALKWIAKGGASAQDAVEDYEYIGSSIGGDQKANDSLDDQVAIPVAEFDKFRSKFVGKPSTPELSAFLEASEANIQKVTEIRDALQYRKNTNKWLRNRTVSSTTQDKALIKTLAPNLPEIPPTPTTFKPEGKKSEFKQTNPENSERLYIYAKRWADHFNLPVSVVLAIMSNETNYQPWKVQFLALSRQGGYGVMQMTLLTAVGSLSFNGTPKPHTYQPGKKLGFIQGVPNIPAGTRVVKILAPLIKDGVRQKDSNGKQINEIKYGYAPIGGAELLDNQDEMKSRWNSGDDSMGQSENSIMHPDTNTFLGCKLLAKNVDTIVRTTGVSREEAAFKAIERYAGEKQKIQVGGRIVEAGTAYAERAIEKAKKIEEKLLTAENKKPPSAKDKQLAQNDAQGLIGGKGMQRQLNSFKSPMITSIKA